MKKTLLIVLTAAVVLTMSSLSVSAVSQFQGSEDDLWKIPEDLDMPNVIFGVSESKAMCQIRIWGMTDGRGKEVKDMRAMIGKTIIVHSKFLNDITHGKNNMIARVKVDDNGWITFTKSNPSTKNGGKPFRDRYNLSVLEDDMWAYIPVSEYQFPDSKGNPGIEVIYTPTGAFVVPAHFSKDKVDLFGVLPSKIYDPEMLQNAKAKDY